MKKMMIQYEYDIKNKAFSLITDDSVNLDNILKLIEKYIRTSFPYIWYNKIITPDNKEYTDEFKNTFCLSFDYNNFNNNAVILNKLRFYFIGTNDNTNPEIFYDEQNGNYSLGLYLRNYSNTNTDNKQYGGIFINLHYFMSLLQKGYEAIFENFESTLLHEILHYYDNILGIYDPSIKIGKAVDIELWCDLCFDINTNTSKNSLANTIYNLCYLLTPTEMKAFANSFRIDIKNYIKHHPNITKQELLKYIKDNEDVDFCFELYELNNILKNKNTYKSYISSLINEDINSYFIYFKEMKENLAFTQKIMDKLNAIFLRDYIDTKHMDIDDIFLAMPTKFIEFMNDIYIPYTYEKIYPLYESIFNTLNLLLEKYLYK